VWRRLCEAKWFFARGLGVEILGESCLELGFNLSAEGSRRKDDCLPSRHRFPLLYALVTLSEAKGLPGRYLADSSSAYGAPQNDSIEGKGRLRQKKAVLSPYSGRVSEGVKCFAASKPRPESPASTGT
jgi:hypothetical protein